MWKFQGEDSIRYFKMERLVMGNKPSASLSGVALAETARLEDFPNKYPAAYKALTHDTYVDNVFLTAPDHDKLKMMISEIEKVASMGGFFFKPFIISGENVPDVVIGVVLPDAESLNEERALGAYWNVKEDTFHIKSNLAAPGKKIKRGTKAVEVTIDEKLYVSIAPHLTLRACLSLHARPFDALGLILPTKVIGNILFRNTLQFIKQGTKGKIPWDDTIDGDLKEKWCEYFSMLSQIDNIHFPRSFKPKDVDPNIAPEFCSFNDGNPDAFGTVGYARWTLIDGTKKCCLMLSKSRLGPLTHKGETVRNELSGATLSARLKNWVQKNAGVQFSKFYHFLDSQIVKDMIYKDSYGFNTFVGLRVAEIQQKTCLTDWKHIPSRSNIADILTKGAPPNVLGPLSDWQNGPPWLYLDELQWPHSPTSFPIDDVAISNLDQYLRKNKAFTQATFNQQVSDSIDALVSRCSDLNKLLRCMALVLRWLYGSRMLQKRGETDMEDQVKGMSSISAVERKDAMHVLVAWDQRCRLSAKQAKTLVPKVVRKKLNCYSFEVSYMVVSGRIKNFPIAFAGCSEDIPILPPSSFAKLVVQFYHNKYHREIDTIVTQKCGITCQTSTRCSRGPYSLCSNLCEATRE